MIVGWSLAYVRSVTVDLGTDKNNELSSRNIDIFLMSGLWSITTNKKIKLIICEQLNVLVSIANRRTYFHFLI